MIKVMAFSVTEGKVAVHCHAGEEGVGVQVVLGWECVGGGCSMSFVCVCVFVCVEGVCNG